MTPEMMIGNGGEQPPPEPDAGAGVSDQLRQLIMTIGQIAQQVPEAQPELQQAAAALTQASIKVVSSQREPGVGQPVVGA